MLGDVGDSRAFDPGSRVVPTDRDPGRMLGRVEPIAGLGGEVDAANEGDAVISMTLEHYPAMTQHALEEICAQAASRWKLIDTLVIHRVGRLVPGDRIVLVGVTSAHRGEAFAACEFIMDFLKTRAPFWKREETPAGARWVEARSSDDEAPARWK